MACDNATASMLSSVAPRKEDFARVAKMLLPPQGSQIAVLPEQIRVPGKSPHTFQDDAVFCISRAALEEAEQYGPPWKFFNASLINEALERPNKILEGLKRANYDDGFCYTLCPGYQYLSET